MSLCCSIILGQWLFFGDLGTTITKKSHCHPGFFRNTLQFRDGANGMLGGRSPNNFIEPPPALHFLKFVYTPITDVLCIRDVVGTLTAFVPQHFISGVFSAAVGCFSRGVNHERKSRTPMSEIQNEIRKSFENPGNPTNPSPI